MIPLSWSPRTAKYNRRYRNEDVVAKVGSVDLLQKGQA